jgi:hypothetical protein
MYATNGANSVCAYAVDENLRTMRGKSRGNKETGLWVKFIAIPDFAACACPCCPKRFRDMVQVVLKPGIRLLVRSNKPTPLAGVDIKFAECRRGEL